MMCGASVETLQTYTQSPSGLEAMTAYQRNIEGLTAAGGYAPPFDFVLAKALAQLTSNNLVEGNGSAHILLMLVLVGAPAKLSLKTQLSRSFPHRTRLIFLHTSVLLMLESATAKVRHCSPSLSNCSQIFLRTLHLTSRSFKHITSVYLPTTVTASPDGKQLYNSSKNKPITLFRLAPSDGLLPMEDIPEKFMAMVGWSNKKWSKVYRAPGGKESQKASMRKIFNNFNSPACAQSMELLKMVPPGWLGSEM